MRYRHLGRTGLEVSEYALGTMMFGSAGNPDHEACARILHAALDRGVNLIDTADMYSAGESEEIVGKALKGHRDDVVLATKGHYPLTEGPNRGGNSRRHLTRAVEASLRRLDTDHLDVYQIHRPDWDTDLTETLATLTDLQQAGKIGVFGCSVYPAFELVEAQRVADRHGLRPFRTEQPPYNLLARGIERDVLVVTERQGMGVLTWSPLAWGFLTGRYRRGDATAEPGARARLRPEWFDPADPVTARKLDAVEELIKVAEDCGTSLPALAAAFPLSHRAVSAVLLGPRTEDQLTSILDAPARLDEATLDRIDAIVPPGSNVYEPTAPAPPPWLADPSRRRYVEPQ
ncbi:aldo/keto reductase [Microlunatus sp. GCM10028923]|uniref:aldo/keto reductase n=1 Tax=Microlunatus sp. GCM10028923 TaxID=3273400 RepID=UPI00361457E0